MNATILLDESAVFVRVVERGSFSGAARELGVPTSTISRQVQRLEDALGVTLLARSTRSLSLTDAGLEYHRRVMPAIAAVQEAGDVVQGLAVEPAGHLRLTAPVDGASWLAALLVEFCERYPKISVETIVTNRTVDLVSEGVDCAIRAGRMRDSALIARRIVTSSLWMVASKDYLDRRGRPRRLEQLSKHDCVLFRAREQSTWSLIGPSGAVEVQVHGRLSFDDMGFMYAAVVAGAGVGFVPWFKVIREVEAGTVERILPRFESQTGGVHFVYPPAQHLSRKLIVFRDFLFEALPDRFNPETCSKGRR